MAGSSELDPKLQEEVMALEPRLDQLNHFQLFSLAPTATADEIRGAFRKMTIKYHPDRFYGKELGEMKGRIDRLFKRCIEAHETLTHPEKRDAYLQAHPELRGVAEPTKSPVDEVREQERRGRFAKHPYLAKMARVKEVIEQAKAHLEKSDFPQAKAALEMVLKADPQQREAKELLARLSAQNDAARAEKDFAEAKQLLSAGDVQGAVQRLRSAVQVNAAHHEGAAMLAGILEKTKSSHREAMSFAQKAVEVRPGDVNYRLLLARLMASVGLKDPAKNQYEEARRLNPEHPEVKKYFNKRWPF